MAEQLLLSNGMLLLHDENDHVIPTRANLLVVDGVIAKISKIEKAKDVDGSLVPDISSLSLGNQTRVIDCTDKIISPGFIDTHHHLWQTPLKGRHGDHSLLDYMPTGNLSSAFFEPSDVFWGQLSGALEALDAGTTTVVDHSHINLSEQHTNHAIAGTLTSGLRSIYCYTPTMKIEKWQPQLSFSMDVLPDWLFPHYNQVAQLLKVDPRVSIGFGFDLYMLPPPAIQGVFAAARAGGAKLITSTHFPPIIGQGSAAKTLEDLGLLDKDILLSHGSVLSAEDAELVEKRGAWLSSTPACEMHTGLGDPIAFRDDVKSRTSLGCCSNSVVRGSLLDQMRLSLYQARAARSLLLAQKKGFPKTIKPSMEEVFNLATVQGARAIGMESEIGRLKEGFKADLVVWNMSSPSMVCAARENPVTAIVGHADTRDVEYVIIDGIMRKEEGKLLTCEVKKLEGKDLAGVKDEKLTWEEIAKKVEESRERIDGRSEGSNVDGPERQTELLAVYGLDSGLLID